MNGLGIDIAEVEDAIIKGMKWKEREAEKWHANMAGIECVFVRRDNIIFVITVYRDGGEK